MNAGAEQDAAELETGARRLDLDWVRIGAFGLLILYHVGMFYVPWDFHVKSSRPQAWLEPIMVITNPWRLSLLFLVSGAATRFMADRLPPGKLALQRTGRLLPPLLLGVFVIVPPQSWMQVAQALHRPPQPYVAFWLQYVTASGHWCDAKGCLTTPTWNHLWFVAYLLVYTLGLMAVRKAASGGLTWLQTLGERLLRDGWALIAPAVMLVALRVTLAPRFPETHALWGDWYLHALSAAVFLFGYLFAKSGGVWTAFVRWRWAAAAVALVAWGAYAWEFVAWPGDAAPPDSVRRVYRIVYGVDQWAWIVAILGFARLHLASCDGPVRRYLTEAIFPFYIVHQTVIVLAAPMLERLGLPLASEAGLLVGLTVASCFASFELVRRIGWLRPLFGLKPHAEASR